MQRLTEEKQNGPFAALKDKAEAIPGAFGSYDCLYAHMLAVTRLKQYEDTGLGPEEITTGKPACVFYCNRRCNLEDDWCTEGPGCPREMDAETAMHWLSPPPNEPLTLEELREMDGEPVWCVDGRGNQCWCLVNCDDGLPCCYDNETGLWEDCFYGMSGDGKCGLHQSGWFAYRRRPEEGTQ